MLNRQISLNVVKNSLARRAFDELGRANIGELLTGPCAIAYGGDSIIDVAKVMMQWCEKLEPLRIKGCFMEGKVFDARAAKNLSKMPNRQELCGIIVRQTASPGGAVAGAVTGPGGMIAGCIKALIEKLQTQAA